MRKNDNFNVDLELLVADLVDSIIAGRTGEYLGSVMLNLVRIRTMNTEYSDEYSQSDVLYNALLKMNKIYSGEGNFSYTKMEGKQILQYLKGLVNYAYLEERRYWVRNSNPDVDLVDIIDVENELGEEPIQEVLYDMQELLRINGYRVDLSFLI